MSAIRISLLCAVFAALLRCVNLAGAGGEGNGSETVARGIIVDSTGAPAAGVAVQLLPVAYDPVAHDTLPAGWHAISGSKGEYRLDNIPAGAYDLEAESVSGGLKALVKNIEISGRRVEVVVDTGRLRKTGTVLVRLTGMAPRGNDYVYVPGTNSFTIITVRDSIAGQAVLSGVPAGKFIDVIYVAIADSRKTDLLDDTITVDPGDTAALAYAAWKYSGRLVLNTAVSGAGITGNVYDCPVLIRLNSAIFDFSRARSKGEDIRFAKSDGTPLAHEIERWDAAARQAEIWVRLDTIFGNNSTQTITMYWGNAAAAGNSNSSAVFDTAVGFQGVWHLGDAPGDSVQDATANRYHGGSPKTASPSVARGNIGNCREFDGNGTFITMPGTASGKLYFPQGGRYSVSAWVMADTLIDLPQTVASKGMYEYFIWLNKMSWQFSEYQDRSGWVFTLQNAVVKQWVLLTGVRDGARQYLYVNGISVDTIIQRPSVEPRSLTSDFIIGQAHDTSTRESACYFRGKIDEVRISSVARSADWIKLCYMNQREDDRLVRFKQRR